MMPVQTPTTTPMPNDVGADANANNDVGDNNDAGAKGKPMVGRALGIGVELRAVQ